MKISPLIKNERVVFCEETDREAVIERLIDQADVEHLLGDYKAFKHDVFERESIISTALGLGIAIPHAKLPSVPEFFIVVGILKEPVEWDSLDKEKVRTVFLIGGPSDSNSASGGENQKKYLEILSKLVLLVKNDKRRTALFDVKSPEEVVELFKDF